MHKRPHRPRDDATSGQPDVAHCDALSTASVQAKNRLRYAVLERRDGARVFARTYVIGENVFALAEIALDALLKSGRDESQAADAMFNLIHYVTGFAIEEQALRDRWVEPKELSNARQAFVEFAEG